MMFSLWEKVATVSFTLQNTGEVDGTEVRRRVQCTQITVLTDTG